MADCLMRLADRTSLFPACFSAPTSAVWLMASALLSFSPLAVAADMGGGFSGGADPTRPPTSLSMPEAEAPTQQANEAPASGLQTIIWRKGAKPAAIINGERVELGGRLGDARLVHLGETEAVLQGPNGKETLRMISGVEIKPVVAPKSKRPAKIKASKKKKAKVSKAKPKSTETE